MVSKGNIILTNTAGWDNNAGSGNGAYLNNAYGSGYVKITNPKSTDINMQHGFDNNSDGLVISTNGTATLTNVNAIGNFGFGIVITGITRRVPRSPAAGWRGMPQPLILMPVSKSIAWVR